MKYREFLDRLYADPAFISGFTRSDLADIECETDAERASLVSQSTHVRSHVRTYKDITIAHPWWMGGPPITELGAELLNQAMRDLMLQPWADDVTVPIGTLWEFNHASIPLLQFYQVWKSGKMAPKEWQ